MKNLIICGIHYEDFLIRMEEFHGYKSPGILLGGIMLDSGLREVEPTPYLNVVSETVVCLPDAVQLLTQCTFGNGFLQVLDWGKFAITAYDRQTLEGERVWLDNDRIQEFPLIQAWFVRSGKRKEKPPFEDLAAEILSAADELIIHQSVKLPRALKNSAPVPTGRCPGCGESYPLSFGKYCPACDGKAYYQLSSS